MSNLKSFVKPFLLKVKSFLLKYPKLYVLCRSLLEINSEDLYKLLIGFYEKETDKKVLSLPLENANHFLKLPVVYDISYGEFEYCPSGFCFLLFWPLWHVYLADRLGFVPMITWGHQCLYYDEGMSDRTDNVFEYYFCPTFHDSHMKKEEIRKNYPICRINPNRWPIVNLGISKDTYSEAAQEDQEVLFIHAEMYKKYIHLNSETSQYLKTELSNLFKKGKTLGVHVRGTDFKQGLNAHPIIVAFDEYLAKAKEIYHAGNYNYVFLATDDCEALELFKKEFGNQLIYYPDTFRTTGDCGPHSTDSVRPLHHYKLGLEVLRDIYTLACCHGLICSLSNVSYAARYISLSLDRKYEDLVILNHGIKESRKAKQY